MELGLASIVVLSECNHITRDTTYFTNNYVRRINTPYYENGFVFDKLYIFLKGFIGMLESKYQKRIIKILEKEFPGCLILKNDPTYIQGIPDLLILYKDKWASLEVKRSSTSPIRPNQKYYVNLMDEMSYSSFIFPENEEEVLNDLQRALRS